MQSSSVRAMVGRTTSGGVPPSSGKIRTSPAFKSKTESATWLPSGERSQLLKSESPGTLSNSLFSSLLGIERCEDHVFLTNFREHASAPPVRRATKARKANRVRRRSHDPHSGISFEIHHRFGRAARQRDAHQLSGVGLSSAGWPGPLHVEQPLPIRAGLRRPLFSGPNYDQLGIADYLEPA